MVKRIAVILAIILFITGFIFYNSWLKLSDKPVAKIIRAAVKTEGLPDIDRWKAKLYLRYSDYNANATVQGSSIPLFNFCLFGYSKSKPENNDRIFEIAQLLLTKGADVNSLDSKSGRTALHEAIFFNQPKVVQFLIKNNANPNIKVDQPKSVFHGKDALDFASTIDKMDNNIDYSKIIKLMQHYKDNFNKKFKLK